MAQIYSSNSAIIPQNWGTDDDSIDLINPFQNYCNLKINARIMIILDNTIVISQNWGKNDNSIDSIHQWMQLAKSSLKISTYLRCHDYLSTYLVIKRPSWSDSDLLGELIIKLAILVHCFTKRDALELTFLKRFPLILTILIAENFKS